MRKVRLTEMEILNFKGIRSLRVTFDGDITSIYGRNASGKTTLFDAVTWVLFGKDSQGRDKFDIKTLDDSGRPISKLPHSVAIVLDVDGKIIRLRREYAEKWVKRRGEIEEEFRGHEEKRLYNDLQCSVSEWRNKIDAICEESLFREITNPLFFSGLKPESQRATLFRMAGDISDADIAHGNKDFEELIKQLDGSSLAEYNQTVAAKKRRVKESMKDIPARIDENKRRVSSLEENDFDALRKEANELSSELSKEIAKVSDKSKAAEEVIAKRVSKMQELSALKDAKYKIEARIAAAANAEYRKAIAERESLKAQISSCKATVESKRSNIKACEETIQERLAYRETLVAEWREINSRTISFDEDSFVCPVCKRPLDDVDVEAKIEELTAAFNQKKAKDLADNSLKGKKNKGIIDALTADKTRIEQEEKDAEEKASELQARLDNMGEAPTPVSADALFSQDAEWMANEAKINEANKELGSIQQPAPSLFDEDEDFIGERKRVISELKDKLSNCNARLAMEQELTSLKERIEDLEAQYVNLSHEFAALERAEFVAKAFTKAKITAIEQKINSMFSFVKFKMFDTQVNGAEVETCEATVNGVPYSSLNAAMRINAGLDIINALCKHLQLCAPIIIDNAESINEIIHTDGQQIRLYVSDDEKLNIK